MAGSVLLGISNGGGQLTWALASVHFAPTPREVPLYNGIHFVLNGIRGLVMPWLGAVFLVMLGTGAVLAGILVGLLSLPVTLQLLRRERAALPVPSPQMGAGNEGKSAKRKPLLASHAVPRERNEEEKEGLVRSERCGART